MDLGSPMLYLAPAHRQSIGTGSATSYELLLFAYDVSSRPPYLLVAWERCRPQ